MHDLLEKLPALLAVPSVDRKKHHPHAVFSRRRQVDPKPVALAGQEGVRCLEENAGPVARGRFAAARAAVLQVEQDLNGLVDQFMRLAILEVHDETDAARIVFVRRII